MLRVLESTLPKKQDILLFSAFLLLHLPLWIHLAAEEAHPEEDENEENPFSTEFQEDQEAAYLKDPKKALQGFYDREGELTSYSSLRGANMSEMILYRILKYNFLC